MQRKDKDLLEMKKVGIVACSDAQKEEYRKQNEELVNAAVLGDVICCIRCQNGVCVELFRGS